MKKNANRDLIYGSIYFLMVNEMPLDHKFENWLFNVKRTECFAYLCDYESFECGKLTASLERLEDLFEVEVARGCLANMQGEKRKRINLKAKPRLDDELADIRKFINNIYFKQYGAY
jgi:hypothetical protein